jgi:outer membrane receptor protein involved in Fe transport
MHRLDNLCRKDAALSLRAVLAALTALIPYALFCQPAHAQSTAVSGLVTDPTGGAVPNVQITLTNETTGIVEHSKTSGAGLYYLPIVQPGSYSLSAEREGFKRFEETAITVETAQNVSLDVKLQVGGASRQSITVNSNAIEVNSVDAAVSTVVDQQFVENIPMNGRTLQSLIAAVPGVVYVYPSTGGGAGGGLTVNGQRTEENYFSLDGVSATAGQTYKDGQGGGTGAGYGGNLPGATALGTTQSMLSLDDLQEFRATTSTYSAEYGRMPGGQFALTSRSGSNEWHGGAFDYLRNGDLDANNTFNNMLNVPKPAERQNDFGGTWGGPVIIPKLYNGKDKTFFFFSYEGLRLMSPTAAQSYVVPTTTAWNAANGIVDRTTGAPLPGLIDMAPAEVQFLMKAFPLPNAVGIPRPASVTAQYNHSFYDQYFQYDNAAFSSPSSIDATSVRIDHSFSDNFKMFGRFSDTPSDTEVRGGGGVSMLQTYVGNSKSVTIGATNLLSSRLTNDLRFGYTGSDNAIAYAFTSVGGATIPDLTVIPGYTSGMYLSYSFGDGTNGAGNYRYPSHNSQQQFNVVNTTSLLINRHNLKWGVDYRRTSTAEARPPLQEYAMYSGIPAILANQVTDTLNIREIPYSTIDPIYINFSAFVQDEWRATPRLSVSAGLRWDVNPAPTDGNGHDPYTITEFSNIQAVALAPEGTPLWKTKFNNLGPRLGLAYQLSQTPGRQTVLRSGFGMFYDTTNSTSSHGYNGVGITASETVLGASYPFSPVPD